MENLKMNFEEIKTNKDKFLQSYELVDHFKKYEKRGGSWQELIEIGEEYESNAEEYLRRIQEFISVIAKFEHVHSYRYRLKKTDSLLKKRY